MACFIYLRTGENREHINFIETGGSFFNEFLPKH